jgi:lipopolysaccharide transport system permease protein
MPVAHSRALLWALVSRNLKTRYQRSALGILWALLNPALTILCLVIVFSKVLRIQIPDYWAFLLSGYFAWVFLVHTVSASATLLRDHAYMLRSVAVQPDILVLSTAIARGVEFLIEISLVALALALFKHHRIPLSYLALPLAVAIHFALILALSYPVAALGVFFHDVQHALPVLLTALGYISPVFYSLDLVPASLRAWFLVLNPITRVLPLFHSLLFDATVPGIWEWVLAAVLSVSLYVIGLSMFRWRRPVFAEIV